MINLLLYWKEITIGALVVLLIWFGYHVKDLIDKGDENSALRKEITRLASIPPKIVTFNQKFDHALKNTHASPDDCGSKPLPPSIGLLLK